MERLISLFREADYEQWSPSHAPPQPAAQAEPLYFQQLLECLRQEKAEQNGSVAQLRQRRSSQKRAVAGSNPAWTTEEDEV